MSSPDAFKGVCFYRFIGYIGLIFNAILLPQGSLQVIVGMGIGTLIQDFFGRTLVGKALHNKSEYFPGS
jgi:hypothetical protein